MSSSTLTMIGLYNYDNTIFDGLTFPAGINKQIAVDEILTRCGEFEILYPNLAFLKSMITHWGDKHYRTFDKWISALNIEFEPLYNYDRYEEYTDNKSAASDSDTDQTDSRVSSSSGVNNSSDSMSDNSVGVENKGMNGEDSAKIGSSKTSNELTQNSQEQTETGSDTNISNSLSQTGTVTDTDQTNTRNVSAYDSATYQPKEQEIIGTENDVTGDGLAMTSSDTTKNSAQSNSGNNLSIGSETGENNESREHDDRENTIRQDSRSTDGESSSSNSASDVTNGAANTKTRSNQIESTKHTAHLYGNIGVTTSMQMLEDYIRVERFNIYEQIADIFVDEFCIRIY